MKSVLAFFLLTLTFLLNAQTKIVKFEEGHLTVEVANKWTSTESKRTLSLTQKTVNDNLQITYGFSDELDLDGFYETYISKSFPKAFEGYEIIEEKDQKINGKDFKTILFNTKQQGRTLQTIVYLTKKDDLGYAFVGTSTPSRMNSIASEFYNIVSSVKFLTPNLKPIVKDKELELVSNKKWILTTQDLGFGHMPISMSPDSKIYFIIKETKILEAKVDNSNKCEVSFEYDNSTNTISFFCRGRNLSKQILNVTSTTLTMKEVDDVGETIERNYKVGN